MKNIILSLIGLLISPCLFASISQNTTAVSDCIEKTVDLYALKENLVLTTQFNGIEVRVYNRNKNQIAKSKLAKHNGFEQKAPWWWKINKHPIDFDLSNTTLRSSNEELFVFYGRNPINGYRLMYFSESNNAREKYEYLTESWEGGFVDVVNGVAYDFTGRPVAYGLKSDTTQEERNLTKLNLLVPRYKYNKESNEITLLCS